MHLEKEKIKLHQRHIKRYKIWHLFVIKLGAMYHMQSIVAV